MTTSTESDALELAQATELNRLLDEAEASEAQAKDPTPPAAEAVANEPIQEAPAEAPKETQEAPKTEATPEAPKSEKPAETPKEAPKESAYTKERKRQQTQWDLIKAEK